MRGLTPANVFLIQLSPFPSLRLCSVRYLLVCAAIKQESPVTASSHVRLFLGTHDIDDKDIIVNLFTPANSLIWLLFATSAFGMGLDISDIRIVVILGSPATLSDVYQFLGRGGRDGLQAFCYFLWQCKDMKETRKCVQRFLGRGDAGFQCYWSVLWTAFSPRMLGEPRTEFTCCTWCDVQTLISTHAQLGSASEPPVTVNNKRSQPSAVSTPVKPRRHKTEDEDADDTNDTP